MHVRILRQRPDHLMYYVSYADFRVRSSKMVFIGMEFCQTIGRLQFQRLEFLCNEFNDSKFSYLYYENFVELPSFPSLIGRLSDR